MKLKTIKLRNIALLFTLPLLCLSCGKIKTDRIANLFSSQEDTVEVTDENENRDEDRIKEVVEQWNSSLNNRDLKKSEAVYADMVQFYTQEVTAQKASELRVELATKDPSWMQTIVTDIEISDLGDGLMEAAFTKQSNSKDGVKTYPAYLYLRNIDGDWRIVKESDKVTDMNVANRKTSSAKIPSDAIRGDFDGDGKMDHVWIEGNYDEDGYAKGKLRLRSDRKNLEGLTWSASRGVQLVNLGDLNNSNRDFLGCIPYNDSTWTIFELYGWKDGKWKAALQPFPVWMGDEDSHRVLKTNRKGYVQIKYHNMTDDIDDSFNPKYQTLKLNW